MKVINLNLSNYNICFIITDIDFELLSTFDLQSTGGVEFAVENSKIFIPNAAIKEQMSSEGAAYIYCYVILYVYDVQIYIHILGFNTIEYNSITL